MNQIPNPFQNNGSIMSPSTPQASSPGFLMMTRPASACNLGSDGRGRSRGRANYSRPRGPYMHNSNYKNFGNQNQHFNNNRGSHNHTSPMHHYNNRNHNQQSYHSPNNSFHKQNSFCASPTFQSTPNSYRGNYRRGDRGGGGGGFNNRNSFNKSNSFHKTPLKDVPVDKFISISMIRNPWEEFDSDSESGSINDSFSSSRNYDSSFNKTTETILETDSSFSIDGVTEALSSTSDGSPGASNSTSDSLN